MTTTPRPPAADAFLGNLRRLITDGRAVIHASVCDVPPLVQRRLAEAIDLVAASVGDADTLPIGGLQEMVQAIAPSLYRLSVDQRQPIDTASEHICVQALLSPCVLILLICLHEACPGAFQAFG
jgi:hypothetical protein